MQRKHFVLVVLFLSVIGSSKTSMMFKTNGGSFAASGVKVPVGSLYQSHFETSDLDTSDPIFFSMNGNYLQPEEGTPTFYDVCDDPTQSQSIYHNGGRRRFNKQGLRYLRAYVDQQLNNDASVYSEADQLASDSLYYTETCFNLGAQEHVDFVINDYDVNYSKDDNSLSIRQVVSMVPNEGSTTCAKRTDICPINTSCRFVDTPIIIDITLTNVRVEYDLSIDCVSDNGANPSTGATTNKCMFPYTFFQVGDDDQTLHSNCIGGPTLCSNSQQLINNGGICDGSVISNQVGSFNVSSQLDQVCGEFRDPEDSTYSDILNDSCNIAYCQDAGMTNQTDHMFTQRYAHGPLTFFLNANMPKTITADIKVEISRCDSGGYTSTQDLTEDPNSIFQYQSEQFYVCNTSSVLYTIEAQDTRLEEGLVLVDDLADGDHQVRVKITDVLQSVYKSVPDLSRGKIVVWTKNDLPLDQLSGGFDLSSLTQNSPTDNSNPFRTLPDNGRFVLPSISATGFNYGMGWYRNGQSASSIPGSMGEQQSFMANTKSGFGTSQSCASQYYNQYVGMAGFPTESILDPGRTSSVVSPCQISNYFNNYTQSMNQYIVDNNYTIDGSTPVSQIVSDLSDTIGELGRTAMSYTIPGTSMIENNMYINFTRMVLVYELRPTSLTSLADEVVKSVIHTADVFSATTAKSHTLSKSLIEVCVDIASDTLTYSDVTSTVSYNFESCKYSTETPDSDTYDEQIPLVANGQNTYALINPGSTTYFFSNVTCYKIKNGSIDDVVYNTDYNGVSQFSGNTNILKTDTLQFDVDNYNIFGANQDPVVCRMLLYTTTNSQISSTDISQSYVSDSVPFEKCIQTNSLADNPTFNKAQQELALIKLVIEANQSNNTTPVSSTTAETTSSERLMLFVTVLLVVSGIAVILILGCLCLNKPSTKKLNAVKIS